MSRQQALADILAATSDGVLGTGVVIDGKPVQAVRRGLTAEETEMFARAGLSVEGIRLSFDVAALGWQPTVGSGLNVDGRDYRVRRSHLTGSLLKLTLTRKVG